METTLIDQGISLMLFGMGTVFVFLAILVFATTAMSTIVNKFSSEDDSGEDTGMAESQIGSQMASPQVANPQIIRAIEKAIAAHRAKK